jgi:DNA polymerase sigma
MIFGSDLSCDISIVEFSSEEKAKQFYEYMKEYIDKYFKMRKELKF